MPINDGTGQQADILIKLQSSMEHPQSAPVEAREPLTNAQKKAAVSLLLQNVGIVLMANVPKNSPVRADFERQRGVLLAGLKPDQREILFSLRDAIKNLTEMLVKCQNIPQLYQAFTYLENLNSGQVWIVEDQQEKPDGMVSTQERFEALAD